MNMLSGAMSGFSPLTNAGQFAGGAAGVGLNINIGLNLTGQSAQIRQPFDTFSASPEMRDGGYPQNFLSALTPGFGNFANGLNAFPGLGNGMGMVPGFGGTADPAGSMFGGLMQQMQSQQQMMQMMMMMLMMMMQQKQNGFGGAQGGFPGMNGAPGIGGGAPGIGGGGAPGIGGGSPGIGGGSPGIGGGSPGISGGGAPSASGGAAPAGATGGAAPAAANAAGAPQSTAEIQQRLTAAGVSASDKSKVAQLTPEMQARTTQLYEYAKKNGMHFTITSGKRDRAQQEALYAKYGSRRAAKPGSSPHESGLAIDINADSGTQRKLGAYWKSLGGRWGGDWGGPGSTTQQELWHFDIKK